MNIFDIESYLNSKRNYRCNLHRSMKRYLISGQVDNYRIKVNLMSSSPSSAINVFKNKYPNAEDVYVIQDLFKKN